MKIQFVSDLHLATGTLPTPSSKPDSSTPGEEATKRGYKKLREGFEGAGLPMPKIENVDGGVKVTFMRKNANGGNVVDNVGVNAIDGLTERQQIIHTAIKQNVVDGVVVTASTLSKQLKVHPRTIQRDLAVLASKHLIRHVGSDRTGHWEPIEK